VRSIVARNCLDFQAHSPGLSLTVCWQTTRECRACLTIPSVHTRLKGESYPIAGSARKASALCYTRQAILRKSICPSLPQCPLAVIRERTLTSVLDVSGYQSSDCGYCKSDETSQRTSDSRALSFQFAGSCCSVLRKINVLDIRV
jgi:hypothetical protein